MSQRARAFGAVLLLAFVAHDVRADFTADFKNGVTAFDRKRWAETARLMKSAIAANPTESGQKILIYGTRYVEYTPHLYLAAAAARLNDCATALPALAASEQQGVASRLPFYREVKQAVSACGPAPAPVQQQPAPATPAPPDPGPVEPSRPPEARPVQQPAPAPVQREPTAVPQPSNLPPLVTNTPRSGPTPAEVAGVRTIDRRVVDAVRSYVRGDYGRALSLLQGSRFEDEIATTQAALFRAAARYALYLVGGANDTTLRKAAVADLREYRRMSTDPPDPRVFAPPFRRFYSEALR